MNENDLRVTKTKKIENQKSRIDLRILTVPGSRGEPGDVLFAL